MAASKFLTKVAIVGAGGNSGRFMTEALLKTGKHTVTAITRADSKTKLPQGVITKTIDYEKPETITAALQGQDALVITLSGYALANESKLIKAAADANVPWVLPNEWSPDTANEEIVKDVMVFQTKPKTRQAIKDLNKSSFISLSTGFWYEWSMSNPPAFGFDFSNKAVTLFDEGETKISLSTWPQVGRAVAALLSLPVHSENGPSLDTYRNQVVYVNSFTVSQKDMLASVLRVTGDKEEDWTISKESSKERYTTGIKQMKEGEKIGFAKMMYTRVFYQDGSGNTEAKKTQLNEVLGLKKDDLDVATKAAIERSKEINIAY